MLKRRKNGYPNDLVFSLQIIQFFDLAIQDGCRDAAKRRRRQMWWKNSSFLLWRFRPRIFCEMIILMFIFFFFLFLALFIVEVPSDVSGAGRSISGAGSCRSVLGDNELLNGIRKLGSIFIGKGVQN